MQIIISAKIAYQCNNTYKSQSTSNASGFELKKFQTKQNNRMNKKKTKTGMVNEKNDPKNARAYVTTH